MAISKGFIQCPERHCSEVAEVLQAGGKRASLYTKCPACGTNQGNGLARQKYLSENLKATRDELNVPKDNSIVGYKSDTEETPAIPTDNQASSVSGDTETEPKPIPKDMPSAPPVMLGALALIATLITAFFATRKPKHKGQTA